MCRSFMDLAEAARRAGAADGRRGVGADARRARRALVAALAAGLGREAGRARVQDLELGPRVALDLLGLQIIEDDATDERLQGGLAVALTERAGAAPVVTIRPLVIRLVSGERTVVAPARAVPADDRAALARAVRAAWRELRPRLAALARIGRAARAA